MHALHRQRGIGWFGLLFVLSVLGLASLITMKSIPIYLNEMKIKSSVEKVAADPEAAAAGIGEIRKLLQRYWDIEDITRLMPADIIIVRQDDEKLLSYDYEAVVPLFSNVSLLFHFKREIPIGR